MEPQHLQQHWNSVGEQNPLWAIHSDPAKRGRGWDGDLEEFVASGRVEVDDVLRVLADRGIAVQKRRALDFGCGVGRLTRALAERFDLCDGVDFAASMIERARELGDEGERVRFHHNAASDLRLFGDESFDFVLSLIVLQHMEPALIRGYMGEFMRVLRPRGVAFFSVPERFLRDEPLPPEACRASLTLIGAIPPLVAGRTSRLKVRVRNDSPVQWPSSARVRVADVWRVPGGRVVSRDDARNVIETRMDPGAECELEVTVLAPFPPGEYALEIDLLQERIGWFSDRGSSTLKLPVTVAAEPERVRDGATATEPSTSGDGQSAFVPVIEMHVMSREDVVAAVESAGGVVMDILAKDRCGPSTPSLDYVAVRAAAPPRMVPRTERRDPQYAIEARIRDAIKESTRASRYPARGLVAADPRRSERNRLELSTMEDRADLVGFQLTSSMKSLGRASTGLRDALRRLMFQVLHRQTEFNRAATELIRSQQTQIEALGASVRAQIEIQAGADARLDAAEHRLPMLSDLTGLEYLSFRERFHGTAQERRDRLRRFVQRFEGRSEVIDAGCGAGEFLELLRQAGVDAVGVDSDETMVDRCRELGYDAIHDDVLHFLRGRPEESHDGIFAAYLVEHLERGAVTELVRLAFSRLRPGGALVMATVNPSCLLTYASFYGDFTHVAPVPALALEWLARSCGFASIEVEYASPAPAEHKLEPLPASAGGDAEVKAFNRGLEAANELLFGFQEYALIARKPD